jgi:large subunit ribosomal protein L25
MEQVSLRAERREAAGTGPARRVRDEGDVPAVLYGRGLDSTPLRVSRRDLYSALHTESGTNALINLEVGSDKYLTIARELQRHPVRGEIIHLDFINISLDEEITAEVSIEYLGEPAGVDDGGVVETIRTSVMVSALPMQIPSSVEVDISELGVGDTLTAAQLPEIEGVEYLEDEDSPLVTVVIPAVFEEPTVAEVELDEEGMPILVDDEGEPIEGDEDGEPIEAAEGEADAGDDEDEG